MQYYVTSLLAQEIKLVTLKKKSSPYCKCFIPQILEEVTWRKHSRNNACFPFTSKVNLMQITNHRHGRDKLKEKAS